MTSLNFSFVIDGVLAGMAMPGVFASLDDDLAELHNRGIRGIVGLTESGLDASKLGEHGLDYLHVPIRDLDAPTLDDVERFLVFLRAHEATQQAVVVHCRVGQGRTGTMLACALVARGFSADAAIERVRSVRRGSINSKVQERFIAAFEASRIHD